MIRSVLRTLLRRQLQEAIADAWTDADLNVLLDAGCDLVAARVYANAPDRAPVNTQLSAFTRVAGYNFALVALPAGFTRMSDVALLQSNGTYLEIPKRTRAEVEGLTLGSDACWAYYGSSIEVGPAPVASLPNGVRLRYNGGIVMAADGDSPPFASSMHMAVVYEAKGIALGETSDDDTPNQRTLAGLYSKFAAEYLDGGGEPEYFGADRKSSTQY